MSLLNAPFIWSIKNKNLEMIKFLIIYGADIDAQDNNDNTLLIYSCKENYQSIIKHLVEQDAKVNDEVDRLNRTPLVYVLMNNNLFS